MAFSISQMIVDGSEKVVALKWTYSNEDGVLANQHKLAEPYGKLPLQAVTEEVAVRWLTEQLQNTPEEFDAAIAAHKAEVEYAQSLVAYEANAGSAPTRVVPETPDPEVAPY